MNKRIEYFDYLRIAATFAVIMLHVAAENYYTVGIHSSAWGAFNIYDSIVRWGVPIFVMISGTLFLEARECNLQKLYRKNIFRMITAFVFWSIAYALVNALRNGIGIKSFVVEVIAGHYHMWFLFMIVGLYMIVPFLKKIVETESLMKYFLVLTLCFTFVIPYIAEFISIYSEGLGSVIKTDLENMHFHFTMGYVGYFVLGYYLNKIELKKQTRLLMYILGAIGFVATGLLTQWISFKQGTANVVFYKNFTINVMLEAVAVFVFAKYNLNSLQSKEWVKKLVRVLAKYSFGAYLVHAMVIEQLSILGFNALSFNSYVAVPVISVVVFMISYLISMILSRIPILGKYIV